MDISELAGGKISVMDAIRYLQRDEARTLINEGDYTKERFPLGYDMWEENWKPPVVTHETLKTCRPGTLGWELKSHLKRMDIEGVEKVHSETPSERFSIDKGMLFPIWVENRMKQTHDYLHVVLGLGVDQDDEMKLQGFYLGQGCQPLALVFVLQSLASHFKEIGHNKSHADNTRQILEHVIHGMDSTSDMCCFPYEEYLDHDLKLLRKELAVDWLCRDGS